MGSLRGLPGAMKRSNAARYCYLERERSSVGASSHLGPEVGAPDFVINPLERLFDPLLDSRSLRREMLELAHVAHPGLVRHRYFRRPLHLSNYLIANFYLSLNCTPHGDRKQVPHRAKARFGGTKL